MLTSRNGKYANEIFKIIGMKAIAFKFIVPEMMVGECSSQVSLLTELL